MQGRELSQFVTDVTWYLRNLLLVKTSDAPIEDVIDVSSDNLARLREEAESMEAETIMRYIRIFSELSGQVKYATQKRILIEMTLIKLCKPAMETTNDAVVARIQELEEKMEKGIVQTIPVAIQSTQAEIKEKPILPKAIPEEIKEIVSNWPGIVAQTAPPMKMYLKSAKLSLGGDNSLLMVLEDGLAYDNLMKAENISYVEEMLSSFIQKEVKIRVQRIEQGQRFEENYVDLSQMINMDIEYVEE